MIFKASDFPLDVQKRMGIASKPLPSRKPMGEGDHSRRKAWECDMARLPGLFLPIRIHSEANMRDKWGAIHRAKKQREFVALAGGAFVRSHKGSPVVVTLTRYGVRELDDDNLARGFKAVRDEIAKLLEVDDGNRKAIRFEYREEKANHYGIRVEIEMTKGPA